MSEKKLTGKQPAFVEYYLQTRNATKAAELAGYKGTNATLRVVGSQNLTKHNIKAAIENRLSGEILGANQVLWNLSRLAQIVNIADYISFRDIFTRDKKGSVYLTGVIADFDIDRFNKDGFGELIKGIRNTASGPVIELRDPESANVWIGKHYAQFIDKFEGEIKTMEKGYRDISPDDWDEDEDNGKS